jgi:hypothetical protein
MDDFLWEHFLPVWRDFGTNSAGSILIAGGYGLFLKQQWLKQVGNIPTVIPFQNWIDTEPRVTKDVDLIVGLDLIKDSSQQKTVLSSLSKNGFEPSDRPHEQRWKFIKRIQGDRSIVVEMHASKPERGMTGIIATDKRVKHKPSLGSRRRVVTFVQSMFLHFVTFIVCVFAFLPVQHVKSAVPQPGPSDYIPFLAVLFVFVALLIYGNVPVVAASSTTEPNADTGARRYNA